MTQAAGSLTQGSCPEVLNHPLTEAQCDGPVSGLVALHSPAQSGKAHPQL